MAERHDALPARELRRHKHVTLQQAGKRSACAPRCQLSGSLAACSQPSSNEGCTAGAYVMKTCFQTSTISSAMFITAMAANPLAVDLARDALGQTISWGLWAAAGLVPGIICLVTAPLILYVLYPPEMKDTPDAPVRARCSAWFSANPSGACVTATRVVVACLPGCLRPAEGSRRPCLSSQLLCLMPAGRSCLDLAPLNAWVLRLAGADLSRHWQAVARGMLAVQAKLDACELARRSQTSWARQA